VCVEPNVSPTNRRCPVGRRADPIELDRREFFGWTWRGPLRLGVLGAVPSLLAACGRDEPAVTAPGGGGTAGPMQGDVIVGDVLDHALRSDEWEGPFGFVTFRLHHGLFEGEDVYFIRTDTSDQGFAQGEGLVWAPKIAVLSAQDLVGDAYLMEGAPDQPAVVSSAPGRPDFTPAWRISRGRWKGSPKDLTSVAELRDAQAAGDLDVERTDIVLNGAVVKWGTQELPVDGDLVRVPG
jgi:hypothetical protein